MALDADWNVIRDLYAKGYNFAQISRQTGVSPFAIRQHATRNGWKAAKVSAEALLYNDESITQRGQLWCVRMMALCESMMSQLQNKVKGKLGVQALETLVKVANTLDQIGRRTFRLDQQTGTKLTIELSDLRPVQVSGKVIDVEVATERQPVSSTSIRSTSLESTTVESVDTSKGQST